MKHLKNSLKSNLNNNSNISISNKNKSFFEDFSKALYNANIAAYASSAAFFVFLSFIPIVLIICAILPHTPATLDMLLSLLNDILPPYLVEYVDGLFLEMNKGSIAVISISAVTILWSSGKGFGALINGINASYGVEKRKNFIFLRLLSCFYTLLFLIMIIFSLIVMVWGRVIAGIVVSYIPRLTILLDFVMRCRFVVLWAFFTFVFQLMYKVFPNKKLIFSYQAPGAIFASVCWTLLSYGFSLYIKYFGGYKIYGSLSTIILTMMWLYCGMSILLWGGVINQMINPWFIRVHNRRVNRKNE